jgi:hypothetical protein
MLKKNDYPKFKNQAEMFNWIWENRPHVSEISGEQLPPKGHFQWAWSFAHILSKGTYPKWKLNPHNIMLLTPKEHENQEKYPEFIERREEMKKEYYKEFYNKQF